MMVVLFFVILGVFAWEIKHAGNCCGGCNNYHECHGNSYSRNDYECPACKNFEERED